MQHNIIESLNKLSINKKNENTTSDQILRNPSITNIDFVQHSLQGDSQCEFVNNVLSYRLVDMESGEFKVLKAIFLKENLFITSIKAVVNPYIKQAFDLKRQFHYDLATPLLLYHGTKQKYVDSICTFNFNWRYSGLENGTKYGKGVNFSDLPTYSLMFCDKKKKCKKVIIIADVLVKNISQGKKNLILPPAGSDTTLGKVTRVFVKFNDNEFYPKYVVWFNN